VHEGDKGAQHTFVQGQLSRTRPCALCLAIGGFASFHTAETPCAASGLACSPSSCSIPLPQRPRVHPPWNTTAGLNFRPQSLRRPPCRRGFRIYEAPFLNPTHVETFRFRLSGAENSMIPSGRLSTRRAMPEIIPEIVATTARWGVPRADPIAGRCHKCKFLINLDGKFSLASYGGCAASASPLDGRIVHEDSGCPAFAASDERDEGVQLNSE
jgi:hypothetical protein